MPGGQYLGLTAPKMREVQAYANRQSEQISLRGQNRGDKAQGKGKGRLWGND